MTVIPAVIALILMGLDEPDPARPDRPAAPARRLRQAHRARSGAITQKLATVPAATSAGLHDALEPHPLQEPRAARRRSCSGPSRSRCCGRRSSAFGDAPPLAVLIQAFFVGMLGNLLPIPGGVGGVEGGMIGAFAAFGVDAGLAVVAVLVFRAFTFWLPLLPGVIAFFRLRARVEEWRNERRRGGTIQSKA